MPRKFNYPHFKRKMSHLDYVLLDEGVDIDTYVTTEYNGTVFIVKVNKKEESVHRSSVEPGITPISSASSKEIAYINEAHTPEKIEAWQDVLKEAEPKTLQEEVK